MLQTWTTKEGHQQISKESVQEILDQRYASDKTNRPSALNQLTVVIVEGDPAQQRVYTQQLSIRALPVNLVIAKDGFEMIRTIQNASETKSRTMAAVSSNSIQEIEQKSGLPESVQLYSKPIPFNILAGLI
ncbi:MAG: hypothetical protein KUG83_09610 [Gammaproteobacteria bacterium]|nr:hypothetical protein [Gammaproteobacteria bacterium]